MRDVKPERVLDVLNKIKAFPDPDNPSRMCRGWVKPYLPSCYTLGHGTALKKLKLNVQLPASIRAETNPARKARLAWAYAKRAYWAMACAKTFASGMEIPYALFESSLVQKPKRSTKKTAAQADKKQQLQAMVSHIHLDRATRVTHALDASGTRQLILAGDSAGTSWQEIASGMHVGFEHAYALDACLKADSTFDAVRYNKSVQSTADRNDQVAARFLRSEKQRRVKMYNSVFAEFKRSSELRVARKGDHGVRLAAEVSRLRDLQRSDAMHRAEYQSVITHLEAAIDCIRVGDRYLQPLKSGAMALRKQLSDYRRSAFRQAATVAVLHDLAKCLSEMVIAFNKEIKAAQSPSPSPQTIAGAGTVGAGTAAAAPAADLKPALSVETGVTPDRGKIASVTAVSTIRPKLLEPRQIRVAPAPAPAPAGTFVDLTTASDPFKQTKSLARQRATLRDEISKPVVVAPISKKEVAKRRCVLL